MHVYRAYVAWEKWRAQDVVSGGGGTFPFPQIPKWGITCGHSLHREWLAVKRSTGGVQGPRLRALGGVQDSRDNAPGGGPGGGAPGSSWVLAL